MKKIQGALVALCTMGALSAHSSTTIKDRLDDSGDKPVIGCAKDGAEGSAAYSYFCKHKSYKEIHDNARTKKKVRRHAVDRFKP